ncbi:hypothetical protein VOLCADRAFT_90151 [Volvox carteri f. nagariensis]|uniref:SET domain-containing protein n=1 Tax=Volvox carteri f. nagariensis TaxID=3068 RepID=D8TTL7_VOLCA|nr:uncharacterized protein VOLCADRAFT_90151 [Volvox carteri f. nagariensis]EFJ49221.1 hypothetical protein VOLCADRAFT_90151 [Volvox carteri f. nagariensis]|eukprot:XP_002949669.1 hypothetical protein VOLCADRAFT_90151 [Volvox carteri f. nagariensis]
MTIIATAACPSSAAATAASAARNNREAAAVAEELEASSLVVVPRALHLDNVAAVAAVGPLLSSGARREAFREHLGQVACCLAIERAKGAESFWLPYVRTLPDMPPNPWLLTGTDLAEAARRRYGGMAEETLEVVGSDRAQLKLDHEGLMWAIGQVVSRSLGSGRASGLLPLIDMANHCSAARPPLMMLDEQDRLVFTLTSIRNGELAPLETGQELFISYQAEDMSPLQAWLKQSKNI